MTGTSANDMGLQHAPGVLRASSSGPSAPLVSIVMPAFNAARFIGKAIESVLAQTMPRFELIVVDDASDDDTCELVARHGDARIRLIRNERNMGPSHSRNRALAAARGEWIALLDADDWYAPERLEVLLAQAGTHRADAVADDVFIVVDGQAQPRSTLFLESGLPAGAGAMLQPAQLVRHEIGALKPMFRRSLHSERGHAYDAAVCYGEDYLLYLSWLLDGARLLVVPQALYFLRRGATGSLTTRRIAMTRDAIRLNQRLLADRRVGDDQRLAQALAWRIRKAREQLVFYRVVCPLRERDYRRAASAMLSPRFFAVACKRLPAILALRFRRIAYRMNRSGQRERAALAFDRG